MKASLCLATIISGLFLVVGAPVTAGSAERASTTVPRFKSWEVIGPAGGDVRVVEIDPRNKDRVIVSTLDGQIYKSFDAGKSWTLLANLERPRLVLDQLAFDVEDSDIIYASGHRHKDPGGFFKSEDGGKTWREIRQLSNESIHAQTQSTKNPNMLVIGTVTGVFASFDRGETWKKIIREAVPTVGSIAIDPRDTNTIYAGTWWRMYKTTNGGASWRLVKNGMIDDSDVFAITIDPKDPDHIIASACSGIYESFNGGELWKKIQGIPSQSRRTRDILQHPSRAGVYYAGTTEGFWMSADAGASWAMTTNKDLEINSITVHPDRPDRVYLGTNNHGILVSEDGGRTFNPNNGNFTSRFTYSITPDLERPNRLYATTQNTATGGGFMFISEDGGNSWLRARNFDVIKNSPMGLVQDRGNPQIIYMATASGILRSTDRGMSWAPVSGAKSPVRNTPVKRESRGPSGPGGGIRRTSVSVPQPTAAAEPLGAGFVSTFTERIKALARTEDGRNGLFVGTDRGLFRTYDPNKGWERLNLAPGVQSSVVSVYVNPRLPRKVWVGTATAGLLVSDDGGRSFSRVETVPAGFPIITITGDPTRPERVFVGTVQTLYVSRDGNRFVRRGGNLPLGNYASIAVNPANPDEVMVASAWENDGGLFHSGDGGWTWTRMDTRDQKLASRRIWALVIDPNNPNRIFAGSHSSGIYRLERLTGTQGAASASSMK